jgi:molybdate transport system substrate-binding protein
MATPVELKVLSSNGIKEAYLEFIPLFERTTGHKVTTLWAGMIDIFKRTAAGETYDLVIVVGTALDELIKQGKIVAATRADLVTSGVGVAVPIGAAKPDLSSRDSVKSALLSAKSIAFSSGPSGVYLTELFERLGIAAAVKEKIKQSPPGTPVGQLISQGDAELGFQQVSELLHYPGIAFLGPLPPEIQHISVFSGGVHAGSAHPDAAKALIDFIKSPAAVPAIQRSGMQPA